ncbi:virulence factor-related M protein-like [Pseudophryne corroboree]|uniref:virulence factor-related M protein-like n=1 Tax=Pseudophryne corroboree TaxID=495146 RepID=UPI0030813DAF
MSSYEVSRFVQRCQKEREDALRREESSRDKLKCLEVSSRSQIQELKAKLKEVTNENKALHRTVKKLRIDLGLEGSPKFRGKMTKDIIKELQEQEDQCSQMKEENQLLSVQLREMVPVIVQTQKQKAELQAQLEGMESKIWDLSNLNTQLSQLLQETQKERDDLEKAYLMYRKSIEDTKKITSRSVQTITSIPVILQSTYKRVSRESSSSQASQVPSEKRKVSLENSNSAPITADNKQKTYLQNARNQS